MGALSALDAVMLADTLVVLAPDARAVTGHDPATLARRWRLPLTLAPGETTQLTAASSGGLYVHAGATLLRVDPASGAVLARQNGGLIPQRPSERAFVWQRAGACGLNTQCRFQPFDCETLRPLGAGPWVSEEMHIYPIEGGPHDTQCTMWPTALGATRDTALFVATGVAGQRGAAVIGYDRATGAERFRAPGCASCEREASGVAPDGSLCWLTEYEAGALEVRAFACATGARAWSYRAPVHATDGGAGTFDSRLTAWLPGPSPAVQLTARGRVLLLDARTGALRWSATVPLDALGMVEGAVPVVPLATLSEMRALVTLEPTRGAVRATVAVPPGGSLRVSARAGVSVTSRRGDQFTSGGPLVAEPAQPAVFDVVRRGGGRQPASVVRVGDGREVWRMPSDGWWVGELARGGATFGAVFAWQPHAPGDVVVFRASP